MEANRLGALLLQFPISFKNTAEERAYLLGVHRRFADYPLVLEGCRVSPGSLIYAAAAHGFCAIFNSLRAPAGSVAVQVQPLRHANVLDMMPPIRKSESVFGADVPCVWHLFRRATAAPGRVDRCRRCRRRCNPSIQVDTIRTARTVTALAEWHLHGRGHRHMYCCSWKKHLVLTALFSVFSGSGRGAAVVFAPGQDPVPGWVQSPDAVTLSSVGFLGDRFVRVSDGGSIATYLTTAALANAVYGMTAAVARFAPATSWVLEVFAGGAPTTGSSVPAGSALLVSASGNSPAVSTEDAPMWVARGTGFSGFSQAPPAGTPIWLRVRAAGGPLGIDSVLGVENTDPNVWFPDEFPTQTNSGNWDFQAAAAVPEPMTITMTVFGLSFVGVLRRVRSSAHLPW
jgi:hypothetical protein